MPMMIRTSNRTLPVALTIAGSDSGGGAGIQADLKTFASLGVHGASAITCVTAQNPDGVTGIQACRPGIVRGQVEAVFGAMRPAAVKTGMLYSAEIIGAIAPFFGRGKHPPLVVDPVMLSTSGSRLLKPSAVARLTRQLFSRALLVTPNLAEAQVLVQRRITSVESMRWAAKEIHARFGCAALVKGGHLKNSREATDIFFDGRDEWLLSSPFVQGVRTHGTGCTYSAAITAYLALGHELRDSVARAKDYVFHAIKQSDRAAGHDVLNSFWKR
jgi:hydroxymethylpyrimidine/phosphomethylpyrimidine kinase